MAELSYGDVQRAVQESIRNLQLNVQRLTSNVGSVSIRADRIEGVEIALRDVQRGLITLQNTVAASSHGTAGRDPRVTQLIHDVYELKTRFSAVERFAKQMSDYVQAKEESVEDEREYRRT